MILPGTTGNNIYCLQINGYTDKHYAIQDYKNCSATSTGAYTPSQTNYYVANASFIPILQMPRGYSVDSCECILNAIINQPTTISQFTSVDASTSAVGHFYGKLRQDDAANITQLTITGLNTLTGAIRIEKM